MSQLEKVLDSGMTFLNGQIEWSDCASLVPSQWAYEDLEIFYSAGHCHDLALALHRQFGYRIGVLFETHLDALEDNGVHLPHHVFAISPRRYALDIRGRRRIPEVIKEFSLSVGLYTPVVKEYVDEESFRQEVMARGGLPPVTEIDIERAATVLTSRMMTFNADYSRIRAESAAAQASPAQSLSPSGL